MQLPLFLSGRIRRSPFERKALSHGAKGVSVYNKMLLPTLYESLEEDYYHLCKYVQIWDVSAERQVELNGRDAWKLAELVTPRDLSKIKVGQGMYALLADENGSIINDPIILRVAEERFWFSTADSDVVLWLKGIAWGRQLDVNVFEPDVSPLAVQGPLADDLMADLLGEEIRNLKFFMFVAVSIDDIDVIVQRSGWSGQGGFEIYLQNSADGERLWDIVWQVGEKYSIRAGCPNLIDRIHTGLLSYGNDMTIDNNPLELGLDRFLDLEKDAEYMSRDALLKIRKTGVMQKKVNLCIEGEPIAMRERLTIYNSEQLSIGEVTSIVFSPEYQSVIAFAIVDLDYTSVGTVVEVKLEDASTRKAVVRNNKWR